MIKYNILKIKVIPKSILPNHFTTFTKKKRYFYNSQICQTPAYSNDQTQQHQQ